MWLDLADFPLQFGLALQLAQPWAREGTAFPGVGRWSVPTFVAPARHELGLGGLGRRALSSSRLSGSCNPAASLCIIVEFRENSSLLLCYHPSVGGSGQG